MKVIGNLRPGQLSGYKKASSLSVSLATMDIGQVESGDIATSKCKRLYEFLASQGYGIRESLLSWDEPALVAAKGNVPPHDDRGLGLIAFWLLHKQPLSTRRESKEAQLFVNNPWLFTNQRHTSMKVGDVVVFNANATHAWMCDGGIYAISQTISRSQKASGLFRPFS